jgi:hypothetical protein
MTAGYRRRVLQVAMAENRTLLVAATAGRMRDDRGGHFVKSKTDTPEYLAPGAVVVKIVIFIVLPSTILIIVTILAKLKLF